MRRAKMKNWPRSWKQSALVGGTLTVKGRSFEAAHVVITERVEAATPEELEARVDDALVERAMRQRPS